MALFHRRWYSFYMTINTLQKNLRVILTAGVLAGALAFTVGCASTPTKASTGEYIDDSVITTKVKAALVHDATTPGTAITVETFKGVVQLSGFVDTSEQKTRAGEISRGIEGVRDVQNNITVK